MKKLFYATKNKYKIQTMKDRLKETNITTDYGKEELEIKYKQDNDIYAIKIDASGIKKAKVSGLLTGKLVIRLNDNKKVSYSIMQGKSDVKKILKSLGL